MAIMTSPASVWVVCVFSVSEPSLHNTELKEASVSCVHRSAEGFENAFI